jgi:hypothetical protein
VFDFQAVDSITLRRGSEGLQFDRLDGEWWQTKPFRCKMDSRSILELIERAQGLLQLGKIEGDVSYNAIGLGEDADAIVLSTPTDAIEFKLGRMTLGGRAYAAINNELPVTVSQSLHRLALDTDHRYWRDTRVFPNVSVNAEKIERRIDDDALILNNEGGRWMIQEPVSARVHQDAFVEWVGRLASVKIQSFVVDSSDDLALFSLLSPRASISVVDREGDRTTVLIGGRVSANSQDRYVQLEHSPMVCRMDWDSLSQLFPTAELIASPTGSGVSQFDIKRVRIATKGSETILKRELDRWVDESRGAKVVEPQLVQSLLIWLLKSHPVSVAIGPFPRDLQVATVTFEGYDRLPMDTVRIALQEDGSWILDNGENVLRLHRSESGAPLEQFLH